MYLYTLFTNNGSIHLKISQLQFLFRYFFHNMYNTMPSNTRETLAGFIYFHLK